MPKPLPKLPMMRDVAEIAKSIKPAEKSVIATELDDLSAQITDLHTMIDSLEGSLAPVLRGAIPETDPNPMEEPNHSVIANEIIVTRRRVLSACTRISDIIERAEC